MVKTILVFLILMVSAVSKAEIRVGSKNFTEQVILGNIIIQLLNSKGIETTERLNLGGSSLTFDALKNDEIDVYVEYTGTGFISILKRDPETNAKKVFRTVSKEFLKRFSLRWSKPIGFENTYGIGFRSDDPKFKDATQLSDIENIKGPIRFGAPHEFFVRKDGFPGLKRKYRFKKNQIEKVALDPGLMYDALKEKQVELITAFTTDGRIKAYNLKILKDDLRYFPPYEAALLFKNSLYETSEDFRDVVHLMEGLIDSQEMTAMNYQVDVKERSAKRVANEFLSSKGLVKKKFEGEENSSFIAKNVPLLLRSLYEHIILCLFALLLASTIAIPLGLFLESKKHLASGVFSVVNIIQTIPSLALLGLLIPILGIGFWPAVCALFLYALLPIARNTYLGVTEISPVLIESARGVGLTEKQILFRVKIPLALPVIIGGIRTATVICVGTATLADLIGAGGLGRPIFIGIQSINQNMILLGAIPAALLAIVLDTLIGFAEKKMISKGLR